MAKAERLLLPLALGVTDGILNALILASASVLDGRGLSGSLALRLGAVGFISSIFTVFVSEYGQLRARLNRSERELNLSASGRLAASRLGRQATLEATRAGLLAGAASFAGAAAPLLIGVAVPGYPWVALVLALGALGGLGLVLARAAGGRRLVWSSSLIVAGAAVGAVGLQLHIT